MQDPNRSVSCCTGGFLCNIPWKEKMTFISIGYCLFTNYCMVSVLVPFFPEQASKKGMSSTVTGLIFSTHPLLVFLSSPLWGKLLPIFGSKHVMLIAPCITALSVISFGLLGNLEYPTTFGTFCFIFRITEAIGAAGCTTAGSTTIAQMFPKNFGTAMALLEMFISAGYVAGPAIGGLFFKLGGYGLPFYIIGGSMMLNLPLMWKYLPQRKETSIASVSTAPILKSPSVVIVYIILFLAAIAGSFILPIVQPHLEKFELSQELLAVGFLGANVICILSCLLCGWISDKMKERWSIMLLGLAGVSFSLLLVGPASFIPFIPSTLWMCYLGLIMLYISQAMMYIPTYAALMTFALASGASDGIGTSSTICGLWSSIFSLGEAVGPFLGGILNDNFGFSVATSFISLIMFISLISITSCIILCPKEKIILLSRNKIVHSG